MTASRVGDFAVLAVVLGPRGRVDEARGQNGDEDDRKSLHVAAIETRDRMRLKSKENFRRKVRLKGPSKVKQEKKSRLV